MSICGNNYIILGVSGGLIEVVDVSSGHIHDISAHTNKIAAIANINSNLILSSSISGELFFWTTANRRGRVGDKSVGFI